MTDIRSRPPGLAGSDGRRDRRDGGMARVVAFAWVVVLLSVGSVQTQQSTIERLASATRSLYQQARYADAAYNADNVATTRSMTVKVSKGQFIPTDMRLALSNPQPKNDGKRLTVASKTPIFDWQARDATSVKIESVPAVKLEGGSGTRLAQLKGEGRYTFTLVATDELNQEYRTESIEIWADCKFSRFFRMKIPCSKTPQVLWK